MSEKAIALKRINKNIEIETNLEGVVELRTGIFRTLIKYVIGPGIADRINRPAVIAANLTKRFFQSVKIAQSENINGITPK